MAFSFEEYVKQPLVSLQKSIEPITSRVPGINQMFETIQEYPPLSTNHLSSDELGSIRLYTLNWKTPQSSFEFLLNKTLRSKKRENLSPWFPYLRLFIYALSKLPSISSHTVYHSLKTNKSDDYSKGDHLTWSDFTSCKSSIEFLERDCQIQFIIECNHAKDISEYSSNENEIILLPGKEFEIISIFDCSDRMKVIQLKEIQQAQPSLPDSQTTSNIQFSIDRLESYLTQFPQLSKIELFKVGLTDREVDIIINHAIREKRCRILLLSFNEITSIGASKIAGSLQNNHTLEYLSLARNPIGDEGVQSLVKILARDKCKLNTLSLHKTGMTDESIKSIVEMLKKNKTLTWLYLGGNKVTDKGFILLADILIHENRTLKALDLSRSEQLTDASGDILLQLLKQNEKLETVWITKCKLSENEKKKLEKFAKLNHRIMLYFM